MGYKRPRASLFARVRACARMSLIASLVLSGAALPSFASLKNPRVAELQTAIRLHDAKAVAGFEADFGTEADPDVRAWTLRAADLVRTGSDADRLAFFETGLADRAALVRLAAVEQLGRLGRDEAAQDLIAALGTEKNAGVRHGIVGALAQFTTSDAAAALGAQLSSDPDANVRIQAAQSLKRLGTAEARDQLRAARQDKDSRVRKVAGE